MLKSVLVVLEKGVVEDHDAPDAALVGLEKGAGGGFGCVYCRGSVFVADDQTKITNNALSDIYLRHCKGVARS